MREPATPFVNSPYPDGEPLPGGGFALMAPAKINLGLHVLGKRPDGYHELDTLFQEISLADRLEFHTAAEWSLEVQGAELTTGPDNLVVKAARRLAEEGGLPLRGRIVLDKHIPIGGGLGGGSSDAAITLIGLARLWGLDWPVERLQPLAAEIGSDCAFFLYGGLAHGTGRGERLELLEGETEEVLLIIPPFGVSTAWAFAGGQFPLTGDDKSVILRSRSTHGANCPRSGRIFRNDLESIVLSEFTDLGQVKQQLLDLGAEVSMLSGSGSTIFGLFVERTRAMHAAQQFGPPFRVRICRTVNRPRRLPTP
jgi:4-diphosphocytidyl-2-C-methyl-D-erythritol kinase